MNQAHEDCVTKGQIIQIFCNKQEKYIIIKNDKYNIVVITVRRVCVHNLIIITNTPVQNGIIIIILILQFLHNNYARQDHSQLESDYQLHSAMCMCGGCCVFCII